MKPKKVRRIYNVAVLVGLGIVLASYIPSVLEIVIGSYDPFLNSIHTTMIHIAAILAIGVLVFGFIFLRCPHCKRLLNFKWPSQGICHKCGARLDDD